jgi:hypothetical protein
MKIPSFKLFAVMDFMHQKYLYGISVGLLAFLLSTFVLAELRHRSKHLLLP